MTFLRSTVLAVAFACVATGLAACGDLTGTATPLDQGDAEGPAGGAPTTYVVTGVTAQGKPRALVDGSEVRISLHGARVVLTAGCNTMSGSYTLDGTRLTVTGLASTEMGCEARLMDQDTWVAGLFAKPVQLSTGTHPTIIAGSTVLSLADRRTVAPDKPLAGTKWLLDSRYDAESASSVPAGIVAYLELVDGTVTVYDSCNGGSGPVRVQGATIVFEERVQNLRGCTADDGGVEKAFADVLAGTTTYAVTEDSLRITKGTSGLGFRAVTDFPAHD
ncbi:MAG: hypothetical protein JWQ74_1784 [Marmoricola sp.]|nr:hypothetical protein [Marmoricola sp.]